VAAVLALAGAALPAYGQGGLEWKFKEGDKFYIESATRTSQTLELKAQNKKSEYTTEQTTVLGFKVLKQDRDSAVLEETIEAVRVKTDDPTNSTAGRNASLLKGATFKVTVTPAGKVARFEGYVEWLKKTSRGNDAVARTLRDHLPEELFKEELATIFSFLPERAVSAGATWKRPITLPDQIRGDITGEAEYTYKGKTDTGEQITFTAALKHSEPPKEPKEAERPVRLNDVKIDDMTGTIYFDAAAGRLIRQEINLREQGSVSFTGADTKKLTFTFKQQTTRNIKLLDKNPLQ
jgi:hypothetical protein